MNSKKTLAIVGLGLLGSSLAAALRKENSCFHIIGVSSAKSTQKALEQKLIDAAYDYDDFKNWKPIADIVILCTPLTHISEYLKEAISDTTPFKKGVLVTDVGSTKHEICNLAQSLFLDNPHQAFFVGGHPMAGSEKRGIESLDPVLYESALWILCPPQNVSFSEFQISNLNALRQIIQTVGSRLIEIPAHLHDSYVARVSHVPQLLSTLLAATVLRTHPDSVHLSGPGFRDMTRLAASHYSMWEGIIQSNQEEILSTLADFALVLQEAQEALSHHHFDHFAQLFTEGQTLRSSVQIPGKGFSYGLCDVIVHIPDAPGMIQKIIMPLTENGLDIRDIELLKVREGSGGTLRLAFKSESEASTAVKILTEQQITAHKR